MMKLHRVAAGCLMVLALAGARTSDAQTKPLTSADIDKIMRTEWKREKITPAPPVEDAQFLRRVTLDITGTIPSAESVKKFLANKSTNKRAEVIEELLQSPAYVKHWVNYWDQVLMGRGQRPMQIVDRLAFKKWLTEKFEKNTPWNTFVYDLLTATGQNSQGGTLANAAGIEMPAMMARDEASEEIGNEGRVNGAVNWFLKYQQAPADLSGNASKIFLGVQIQCAQCHDHKTEKWTQEDFRRFTACFSQTRPVPIDTRMDVKGMRRVELRDINRPLFRNRPRLGNNEYANATPAALDGTEFADSPNRRQALATWITSNENPYFADAIVNRLWAHFMGRGFVDPIDDFRPTNPATLPALMKRVSADFVANDYDLKNLIRLVCNSQVYQLSAAPSKNGNENRYWSRYRLKALEPEVMLDSLVTATNLQPVLERVAGGNVEQMKAQMARQLTFLFDVDEEFEQKDFEGTIPQALLLLNGTLVNNGASPIPGTTLSEVLAMEGGDAKKIEELYLRTVSRKPTATELKKWAAFLDAPRELVLTETPPAGPPGRLRRPPNNGAARRAGGGPDPLARIAARAGQGSSGTPRVQAYEDMFWALLNSSEFMFNH